MCGIAGLLSPAGRRPPAEDELRRMIGALSHRGPDGEGVYRDAPAGQAAIGLAHSRLAIGDLAGGPQPLANEDDSVWVVFNGEIFNHVELRAELMARGHRFRTQSDTEVLVHLYEELGEHFVDRLNGQFAIALWDGRRRELLLARDRTGIRPLFHATVEGRLAFASEAKALFALPELPRALDPHALAEIFTFWAPLGERSVFAGVHSLPPGHVMRVRAGPDGSLRTEQRCYWDWDFPPAATGLAPERTAEDYADELRALLTDAVRLQLRADVPVGAYLSGGLDSSVVAALVQQLHPGPLRTFSLTFEDPEFDEREHQQAMLAQLHTEHAEIRCRRSDIAAAFPRALWHAESPVLRTAPAPLMLLSGLVREQGFKVVLTGEGADEVFGGYDLFKEARVRRFMARQPDSRWRGALLQRLYPYLANSPAMGGAFAQRFFAEGHDQLHQPWHGHLPRWLTTGRSAQFFSPALREQLAGWQAGPAIAATLPPAIAGWGPLARDQYIEAHTLMSGYLLSSQGDRMAMANSVEGRFPFLDHRVIEFANRLPPRYKLMGLTEKYLLKRAMRGRLPERIRQRSKQPYRAPDSQSFFEAGQPVDWAAELLSPARVAEAGYFDPQAVGKLFEKCRRGRAIGFGDNMAFVGILSTMAVHAMFIRGTPAPLAL